jgi:long-chain fatty acid transport protein
MKSQPWRFAVLTPALLGLCPVSAYAVGYALEEQSVTNLGYAYAGAAKPEDASSMYFNPAGMSLLKGSEIAAGINLVAVKAQFTDQGSISPAGPMFPLSGGNGGNPIGDNWVPNLYFMTDLNPRTKLGLGINSPYDLKTEYTPDWLGRYQAVNSKIQTININPAISYAATDQLSVGVGVDFQYIKAELSNSIDFGAACFGSPFGPANCAAAGILPGTKDGYGDVTGNSWGTGFNFGALYKVSADTTIGFAYRSSITQNISANANFTNPTLPGPFAAITAGVTNTTAHASLTIPDSASVSFSTQVTPKMSLLGDLTWNGWGKTKELRVRYDNGLADTVSAENWKDTVRVSLGVGYDYSNELKLRAGINYEGSTVPDSTRGPRLPDNAHTLFAIGATYNFNKENSLDLGYAHLLISSANVNLAVAGSGTIIGQYKGSADIGGVQFRHRF